MLTWKEMPIGGIVTEPGNASQYRTGDWRSQKPIWDFGKCIKCGVCYISCPDIAIGWKEDGYPEWLTYYCKGCGICSHECPTSAISLVEEGE